MGTREKVRLEFLLILHVSVIFAMGIEYLDQANRVSMHDMFHILISKFVTGAYY